MNTLIVYYILFLTLFNFNPFLSLEKNLQNYNSFFKSLFTQRVKPTPTPAPPKNLPIQTRVTKSYTIALVGDSMTHLLGTADEFRKYLKEHYPNNEFGILNFGIGGNNILTVPNRLIALTMRGTESLPPIMDTRPDIILLESSGNNPLSDLPLEQGLKKQNETLDQIVKIIKEKKPDTVLIFVATIAPSKTKYAQGVVDLSSEQRAKWAEERIAYIENHIKYAHDHKIPLVNIYQKSLRENGNGDLDYISKTDFIHPSPLGITFISKEMADYIYKEKVIPY